MFVSHRSLSKHLCQTMNIYKHLWSIIYFTHFPRVTPKQCSNDSLLTQDFNTQLIVVRVHYLFISKNIIFKLKLYH